MWCSLYRPAADQRLHSVHTWTWEWAAPGEIFNKKKRSGFIKHATGLTVQFQLSYINSQGVKREADSIHSPPHLIPRPAPFNCPRQAAASEHLWLKTQNLKNSFILSERSVLNKTRQTLDSTHPRLFIYGLICFLYQFYGSLLWLHGHGNFV